MNTDGAAWQWKLYRIDLGSAEAQLVDTLYRGYSDSDDAWTYHEDTYLANERNGAIIMLVSPEGIHSIRRVTSRMVTQYG